MMNKLPRHGLPTDNLVLPAIVKTRSGIMFDPNLDRWNYRENALEVNLNFGSLPITSELAHYAKKTFIWYAENKSPFHLKNMFYYFGAFLRPTALAQLGRASNISTTDIINYKTSLQQRDSYFLGSLSGFLKKWHALGYPGVTDDTVALLKQLRLKGNIKGEAVLTMDSENGPYTDLEFQSIQHALEMAFEKNKIDLGDYVLVWLYMALGQRSIQYAALKVCDVMASESKEGMTIYVIHIPRAKQRNQLTRDEFKDRLLIPKIGEKLLLHAHEVREQFRDILRDPDQSPLFPAKQIQKNEAPGFEFHRTSHSLASTLEGILNRLNVVSERTGKPLHITATRFRRSIGTRAAIEGHGELVIAELLDHTDTQNVGVYVQARPEIVERIDRAVALHLAPLAQAFAGIIIENEDDASRTGDPTSRVCDPRFAPSMKPMGSCGKYGFCGLMAPLACYTCMNFQPWLDGPHEAVLDYLIAERERLLEVCDTRIASVKDRTILAVAEVVRRCEEICRNKTGVAND
jgi:integrase